MAKQTLYGLAQSALKGNEQNNDTYSQGKTPASSKKQTLYSLANSVTQSAYSQSRKRTREEQAKYLNNWNDKFSSVSQRLQTDYNSRKDRYQNRDDFLKYRDNTYSEIDTLLREAAEISDYYNYNRDSYSTVYGEDTLDELLSYLDNNAGYLSAVRSNIGKEYDYWNLFDSEDTYNQYLAQQNAAQEQTAFTDKNSEGYQAFGDQWARFVELSQRETLTKEEKAEAKAALQEMQSKYQVVDQTDVFYTDMPKDMEKVYINLYNKSNWGTGITAGFMDAFGTD